MKELFLMKEIQRIWKLEICLRQLGSEVFGNSKVVEVLNYSEDTTTSYIKKMYNELHIIQAVEGNGKGKYAFIQE